MTYIIAFLTASVLAILIVGILIFLTQQNLLPLRRRENGRTKSRVSRLGGVAMIGAFAGALFLHPELVIDRQWLVLLTALLVVAFIGIWDDISPLSWRPQLFIQVVIALFLFALDIRIHYISNPFGGIIQFDTGEGFAWIALIVSVIWFIVITNTMNWLDGIDGLGGGIALVGAGAIFMTSLLPHVYQPPVAIAAFAFAGATVGFLIWNWAPARITAGTSGSFFWGLIIAVLALFSGAKIATTLMIMAIPLVDALWVVAERLHAGVSILHPDRRHLHYKLIERGWSQQTIASMFIALTTIIATSSIYFTSIGKLIALIGIVTVMLSFLVYLHKNPKRK